MLKNLHILDGICKKVRGLSIVSKVTAYWCNELRKEAWNLQILCGIRAYLWNQWEKSHIFKESVLRKFHISKSNNEKVWFMQIFAETISYK